MTLVTVKGSSAKAHYQYINYKRTVYRQSAEKNFSTQSLETRSHHLSILVAENSMINVHVFNLTIFI